MQCVSVGFVWVNSRIQIYQGSYDQSRGNPEEKRIIASPSPPAKKNLKRTNNTASSDRSGDAASTEVITSTHPSI